MVEYLWQSDSSTAMNVFAISMVCVGALTSFYIFTEVSWRIFAMLFKFVDKVVNDYHYN